MASLIFAQAKSIHKQAYKEASAHADLAVSQGKDYNQSFKEYYEMIITVKRTEFKEILRISKMLHEDYMEVTGKVTQQWYFITVRPDEKKIKLDEFYSKVAKFTSRACIAECTTSFEQKGTSDDDLGKGFHVHILAKSNGSSWRSKGECLRDTQSSFASCTAANCIQVVPTKEPEKVKQNYLLDYKSDDNHKEITKDWDSLWRAKEGLEIIYEGTLPERKKGPSTCIKSGTGAFQKGTFVLSMN